MFADMQLLLQLYWRIDRRAEGGISGWGWTQRAVTLLVFASFSAMFGFVAAQVVTEGLPSLTQLDIMPSIFLTLALLGTTVAGLNQGLQALFLSDDLEKLFVAPISSHAIVTAKLLGRLPTVVFIVLASVLPATVVYGFMVGFGPLYYLMVILLTLAAPLFGISLGAIIAILLVRILPARRLSEWIGAASIVIGTLISLIFYVPRLMGNRVQEKLGSNAEVLITQGLNRYGEIPLPTTLAVRAVVDLSQGHAVLADLWGLLSYLLFTVGLFACTILLADRMYLTSWLRMQSSGDRSQGLTESAGVFGGDSLDLILGYKDWLLRVRDRRLMATLFSGLILAAFMAFYIFRPQDSGSSMLSMADNFGDIGPLTAIFGRGVMVSGMTYFIAWMSFSRIAASALSMERESVTILKSAPIRAARVMRAKVLGILIPYMVFVTLLLAIGLFAFRYSVLWVPYAWLVLLIMGFGLISYTVSIDFVYPNLTWDDPRKMTSRKSTLPRLIGFVVYSVAAILVALSTFALAVIVPAAAIPIAVSGLGLLAGGTWFFVGWCTRRVEAAWSRIGT